MLPLDRRPCIVALPTGVNVVFPCDFVDTIVHEPAWLQSNGNQTDVRISVSDPVLRSNAQMGNLAAPVWNDAMHPSGTAALIVLGCTFRPEDAMAGILVELVPDQFVMDISELVFFCKELVKVYVPTAEKIGVLLLVLSYTIFGNGCSNGTRSLGIEERNAICRLWKSMLKGFRDDVRAGRQSPQPLLKFLLPRAGKWRVAFFTDAAFVKMDEGGQIFVRASEGLRDTLLFFEDALNDLPVLLLRHRVVCLTYGGAFVWVSQLWRIIDQQLEDGTHPLFQQAGKVVVSLADMFAKRRELQLQSVYSNRIHATSDCDCDDFGVSGGLYDWLRSDVARRCGLRDLLYSSGAPGQCLYLSDRDVYLRIECAINHLMRQAGNKLEPPYQSFEEAAKDPARNMVTVRLPKNHGCVFPDCKKGVHSGANQLYFFAYSQTDWFGGTQVFINTFNRHRAEKGSSLGWVKVPPRGKGEPVIKLNPLKVA
jgi:hypothetical protein